MPQIPLIPNTILYQSGYEYIQASGSNGIDGSSPGFHLRWDFARKLQDHLPKGDLTLQPQYATTAGFNKPGDYVKIYRAEYNPNNAYPSYFTFATPPSQLIETAQVKEWRYNNLIPVGSEPTNTTSIVVRFKDINLYNTLRNAPNNINPNTNPLDFIKAYSGMIEVEAIGKLHFAANIYTSVKTPQTMSSAFVKTEAISTPDSLVPADQIISCRKKFTGNILQGPPNGPGPRPTGRPNIRIVCENIKFIRFIYSNAYPTAIALECYSDFVLGKNKEAGGNGKWDVVADFSLSLTDPQVFSRLDNSPLNDVNGKWPKYNDNDVNTGAFTVKTQNYKDRWDANDPEGLAEAVDQYLTLSTNPSNVKAQANLPATPPDQAQFTISYLNMLRLVALDFHVARMLGLGHIDFRADQTKSWVWVAEYVTKTNQLTDYPSNLPPLPSLNPLVSHLYMTLPTRVTDYRLPPTPVLDDVGYGINISNATNTPIQLTDPQGYSQFDDSRFINLNKQKYSFFDVPVGPFFEKDEEFCVCDISRPVLYGVEYRGSNESTFRKPEISNDPEFFDPVGREETVGILEQPNPFFIHEEREEGIHVYASYAINWFSRSSPVSNTKQTDLTKFKKRRTLLPPLNLGIQLIQKEDPVLLTTQAEQNKLLALINDNSVPDKTLVRVTFDWNHTHNIAYKYATYAELFFRDTLPLSTRGKIISVSNPDSQHRVTVTTDKFLLSSSSQTPPPFVQPNIQPGNQSKFIGGLFTANGKSFVIESVTVPVNGDNPTFLLKQVRETQSNDPNNNNQFTTTETYISPQNTPDETFIAVENLGSVVNWTSKLKRRIPLIKFSSGEIVTVSNAGDNNGKYNVITVVFASGNTEITVKEKIPAANTGDLTFGKEVKILAVNQTTNVFTVAGNLTSELSVGDTFKVLLSDANDGAYTIDNITFNGTDTEIEVLLIPSNNQFGNIIYDKTVPISSVDQQNKKFTINGVDLTAEIVPSYMETVNNIDGSQTELNIGGVFEKAEIKEYLDVDVNNQEPDPDNQGAPPQTGVPGSRTGIFKITFQNFTLDNHPDPDVEWYKGIVRIKDSNSNPQLQETKVLQVFEIRKDVNGNILSPLQIVAFDPTFDVDQSYNPINNYVPIPTGNNIDVNFHPSYRTYYGFDNNSVNVAIDPYNNIFHTFNNNFNSAAMLPALNQGIKESIMAARSIDTSDLIVVDSEISTPVTLIAREVVEPTPPGEPTGTEYATRPDFYGKSTYTFDINVNPAPNGPPNQPTSKRPFALVFYRCDDQKILDTLYTPATVSQILQDLAALQSPDADFNADRWKDLVNGVIDAAGNGGNGAFKEYTSGGYRFPNPNNPNTKVPNPANPAQMITPFTGNPALNGILPLLKLAIDAAFLPLTEQPVLYRFLKPGHKTSNKKPLFKNLQGELIPPVDPFATNYDPNVYDPFPMAVRYAKVPSQSTLLFSQADLNNPNNEVYVRFTDYTLDGSSKSMYFYYGLEISNNNTFSPRGAIKGPVKLVNAFPAESPTIKKTVTQLSNPVLGIPTAVLFELNNYIEAENIKKFQIFRATTKEDALSVRTMALAKTVDVGDDVIDDFSDVQFPPYGDPLFYRIVALREVANEFSPQPPLLPVLEYFPSKPSNIVLTNIVDNINPPAPQISYTSGVQTGPPLTLTNVVLSWPKTAHNAKYYLYKMNSTGNWVKIYEAASNSATISVALQNTDWNSPDLVKEDADGNTIYHRFRVQVENSSGLLNLTENELTV
jgi:hypothetical protein